MRKPFACDRETSAISRARKMILIAVPVLGLRLIAGANEIITGTVIDSATNAPIEAVNVASGARAVKTTSSGSFQLELATTGFARNGESIGGQVSWNPADHSLTWPGNLGLVSITLSTPAGRILARHERSGTTRAFESYTLNVIPHGLYLAVVKANSRSFRFLVSNLGTGRAGAVQASLQAPGRGGLAKAPQEAGMANELVFSKPGYRSKTVSVTVNSAGMANVAVKLVKEASGGMTILFDGTNLDSWDYNGNTTLKNGVMSIAGCWCVANTKLDFDNFRLFVTHRVPGNVDFGNGHNGITFWGARVAGDYTPRRSFMIVPMNCWTWDYVTNVGTAPGQTGTCSDKGSLGVTNWNTTELLVNLKTGTIKSALNGVKQFDIKIEVTKGNRTKGPIGMQDHGNNLVEYKDIQIEPNPVNDQLISLKP